MAQSKQRSSKPDWLQHTSVFKIQSKTYECLMEEKKKKKLVWTLPPYNQWKWVRLKLQVILYRGKKTKQKGYMRLKARATRPRLLACFWWMYAPWKWHGLSDNLNLHRDLAFEHHALLSFLTVLHDRKINTRIMKCASNTRQIAKGEEPM